MDLQVLGTNVDNRKYPIEFTISINKNIIMNIMNKYFPEDGYGIKVGEIDPSNKDNMYVTFSVRMIPYLMPIFMYYCIDKSAIDEINRIISIYSFKPAFNTNPPKRYLTDEQYGVYKAMVSKCGGIIQCRTGWGKGVLISYLVSNYIGDGNILIIAPSLSVLDECKTKFNEFNLDSSIKSRVIFMHAAGFMNSNNKYDESYIKRLNDVDLILIDESVNITESMEKLLRVYCTNYRYIYGFSATANKYKHMELTYDKIGTISNLPRESISLLYFIGQSLAFILSKKGLVINRVSAFMPPEFPLPYLSKYVNYSKALNSSIKNKNVVNYIKYIKSMIARDSVILVPIVEIAQGTYLYNHLVGKVAEEDNEYPEVSELYDTIRDKGIRITNLRVVLWSGSGYVHNSALKITNYDELRNAIDNNEFDVVICTQVGYEGVNFQTINDILLLIGTSNKVVNQIVGRGERSSEELRIWLLTNENDRHLNYKVESDVSEMSTPIFNACNGARMRQLSSAHKYKVNEMGLLDNLLI